MLKKQNKKKYMCHGLCWSFLAPPSSCFSCSSCSHPRTHPPVRPCQLFPPSLFPHPCALLLHCLSANHQSACSATTHLLLIGSFSSQYLHCLVLPGVCQIVVWSPACVVSCSSYRFWPVPVWVFLPDAFCFSVLSLWVLIFDFVRKCIQACWSKLSKFQFFAVFLPLPVHFCIWILSGVWQYDLSLFFICCHDVYFIYL